MKNGITIDWKLTFPLLKDSLGRDLFQSVTAAKAAASRKGVSKAHHKWTFEQEDFLVDSGLFDDGLIKATSCFNKRFRTNLSRRQIQYKRQKLRTVYK